MMNSNLSDQQKAALNRMLALALGYTEHQTTGDSGITVHYWKTPLGVSVGCLPYNWYFDLNAVAAVEAGLTDEQRDRYDGHLFDSVAKLFPDAVIGGRGLRAARAACATAPQRVIAILRTLGRGAEVDRILSTAE